MMNEKEKPDIPRFRDLSRMNLKARSGPALFSAPLPSVLLSNPEELQACAAQAVEKLPLNDKEKGLVKNLVVHFANQVPNQASVALVHDLALLFIKGIQDIPGSVPPAKGPEQGRSWK